MSTMTTPRGAPVPHGEISPRNQQKARALGLTSATGLVIGSIIGTGVFAMPAVLAGAGTSSLLTLGVIALGATLLAVMFGQLTKRVPNSDGGLYAYARHEFGDFAGYLTGWCYWIQCWAGNAAIVSAWVFYVDALFGIRPSALGNWGIALIGLWVPALVNLAGVKQMAWFQNLTVVLKFLPLLFVGIVGWFFVSKGNFGAFNASGGSLYGAIGIAAGRGAVLLHRRRGGGHHRQARARSGEERRPRFGARHTCQRRAVPGGYGRDHGPGAAPRAGQRHRAVRHRVRDDLHARRVGRASWSPRWPWCPGSGR